MPRYQIDMETQKGETIFDKNGSDLRIIFPQTPCIMRPIGRWLQLELNSISILPIWLMLCVFQQNNILSGKEKVEIDFPTKTTQNCNALRWMKAIRL